MPALTVRLCPNCLLLLRQAFPKARNLVRRELPERGKQPTPKQARAAFELALSTGEGFEHAVSLFRATGPGRKPKIALDFAIGIMFLEGFTDSDLQALVELVTGEQRNARYIRRRREQAILFTREWMRPRDASLN